MYLMVHDSLTLPLSLDLQTTRTFRSSCIRRTRFWLLTSFQYSWDEQIASLILNYILGVHILHHPKFVTSPIFCLFCSTLSTPMLSGPKTLVSKIKTRLSAAIKRKQPRKYDWPQPIHSGAEEYLPSDIWDSQNPAERYASAGDLCAHLGEQLPIPVVKLIARDVLQGLKYLHGIRGTEHGDINPDFILLAPRDMKAIITQFTGDAISCYSSDASTLSFRPQYFNYDALVSPGYGSPVVFRLCYPTADRPRHSLLCDSYGMRSPEDILGAPRSTSADLWTLGCVLYELLTGESLFDPSFQTVELGLAPEESHLIQIIELVGELPLDLLKAGKYTKKWFSEDGSLRLDTTFYPVSLEEVLKMRIEESEVLETADFLASLLKLRPEDRTKAVGLLDHPWLKA